MDVAFDSGGLSFFGFSFLLKRDFFAQLTSLIDFFDFNNQKFNYTHI